MPLNPLLAQVTRLALALLCSFWVACSPPPPRGAIATAPAATYVRSTPIPGIRPGAPTPTALTYATAPATNATWSTEGELRLALRENINTLNPYLATTVSELFVTGLLYDTLAEDDLQGGLMPNLAQRWELSANGTKLTCWLNPQARWHNGQPVTADDVVLTFDLIRQTAFPGLARLAALVAQAEALGPTEVQFTLLRPGAETARQVCSQVRIVPAALWVSVPDPLTYANLESPIGSGPFALLDYTVEGGLVLRNTGMHHSTRPSIDRLVVEIIRDESKALQALREGGFDLLGWDITRAMARDVQDHPESYLEIQLAATAGMSVHSLWFNLRYSPYDNPALRSALAQAINTQNIVDQVLLGFAEPGRTSLFPPASLWHAGSIPVVAFDLQQATETLTLAGFVDRDGDGLRENPDGSALQILITYPKGEVASRVVDGVVASWKAAGIKARPSAVPAEQVRSLLMQASFEVVLYDLSLREPEEAFFYLHSSRGSLVEGGLVSGYNYGGYASVDADRVVEMILEEQDQGKRLELLQELQDILAADLPQIPLYSPYILHLYSESRFTGWRSEPGAGLLSRTAIAYLSAR